MIHHCTEERLYTGRRGQGAFCNGQRLQVSRETGGVHSAPLRLFRIEIGEWEMPSVTVTQMVVARVQRVLALFRGVMALVEIDTTYSI